MRIRVLKKYNLLIAFLLSILGFGSACSKDKEVSPGYGSLSISYYNIYGKVRIQNGANIPAIKVSVLSEKYDVSPPYPLLDSVSTFTDYYGNYELKFPQYFDPSRLRVRFEDVDGIALGEYQSKDTMITFGRMTRQHAKIKEINTQLKEKQ